MKSSSTRILMNGWLLLMAICAMGGHPPKPVEDVLLPLSVAEKVTLGPHVTVRLVLKPAPEPTHDFWLFEAHSQDNSKQIVLSESVPDDNDPSTRASVRSTVQYEAYNHPGCVVFRRNLKSPRPSTYLTNTAQTNVTMILYVRGYSKRHPVPGGGRPGLNLTWGLNEVTLEFDEAEIAADSHAGNWGQPVLSYSVYQYYFSERNFDETAFLDKLSVTMLTLDDIIDNGVVVNDDFVVRNVTSTGGNRVVFGAYAGTAAIFSVVVSTTITDANGTDHDLSSVYVTSATYSCQLDDGLPLNCQVMWFTVTKVICGVSVFVGAFLALFGHRHYLPSQFLFGTYITAVVAFIVIAVTGNGSGMEYTTMVELSIVIGLVGGFLWALVWYTLGLPLLSTLLPTAMVGLLLGAVFVYLPAMNVISMAKGSTFWTTIAAFVVGCVVAILPFTKTASIVSCALLGTFIFIIPIDHYVGSSLKFILVNLVRRAYVDGFQKAVLYFPFQTNDIALVCGWICLAVVALVVQITRERNRAPFPPNPYQLRRWRMEENMFRNENAVNNIAEEHQPLLTSPNGTSGRIRATSPTSSATTNRPVVGYIATRSQTYGTMSASSPIRRGLESPTLYERQPHSVAVPSPSRRFWATHRQTESLQQMATSVEERDFFRPPAGHPSQT